LWEGEAVSDSQLDRTFCHLERIIMARNIELRLLVASRSGGFKLL